jgi:hypothetical protein
VFWVFVRDVTGFGSVYVRYIDLIPGEVWTTPPIPFDLSVRFGFVDEVGYMSWVERIFTDDEEEFLKISRTTFDLSSDDEIIPRVEQWRDWLKCDFAPLLADGMLHWKFEEAVKEACE